MSREPRSLVGPTPATATPRLRIRECFVSIQGEGILAGIPSSFVRVAGCNLRCDWCDSPRTSWRPQGDRETLDTLVEFCASGPRHVVITGGEPLLFEETIELTQRLASAGHHITIETAGTVWQDGLHCDLASVSPKLAHSIPDSLGPSWAQRHDDRRWRPEVVRRLMTFDWQLKFVVRAGSTAELEQDCEELSNLLRQLDVLPADRQRVLLMPECVDPKALPGAYARVGELCKRTGFRLGPRMHIEIYGHTEGT